MKLNENKDSEKDKKLAKISEKRVRSKSCVFCKKEILDSSSILKFKSSDDFITYCKLFFEKLSLQKKEVYSKSIVSFDKYYTEKYSNFEIVNNIIFKGIKSICIFCYQENMKEEGGFISILANLNYNIILKNNKRIKNALVYCNYDKNQNMSDNFNLDSNIKKEELSLELKENIKFPKKNADENNKDSSLSEIKSNNNNQTGNKAYEGENSQGPVGNLSERKNSFAIKDDNSDKYEEHIRIGKKNSTNSDKDYLNSNFEMAHASSSLVLNNDLLGKKLNRNEKETIASMQNKFNSLDKMVNVRNPENIEGSYYLNNNYYSDNISDEKKNRNFPQDKNIKEESVNKINSNSNLNMNTKNISLENLNITNVFMKFDKKTKPILIDSKISNNKEHFLKSINNNQSKINKNYEKKIDEKQSLIEDLKKSYIDLKNCSLDKKLFLYSLQKKSENLINNLADFDKNKQQGINFENNNLNNKSEQNENEKKNFVWNNSQQMELLMNSINEQLEDKKNIIYPAQKIELKEIQHQNIPQTGSPYDHYQAESNNYQQQNLKLNNAIKNEIESIVYNIKNNNKSNDVNDNCNMNQYYPNSVINKTPSNALVRSENSNLNSNDDNKQIINKANKSSNLERESSDKNPNKHNLIDRILNKNNMNSINATSNSMSNNLKSSNLNLIYPSGKNSLTITEDASHRNNNNNNKTINNDDNNKNIQDSDIYNNLHNMALQQMLMNNNQAFQQQINFNNSKNYNSHINGHSINNLNNLQGNYLQNNVSAANSETKKHLSDQSAMGNLNLSHQNLLLAQNNQLRNQTLSGMVHNSLNFSLPQSALLAGIHNIPNIPQQSNQLLPSLNHTNQLNPNLIASLDAQALLLQNNLLNHNPIDLSVLGLDSNSLIQLPLPYQLQMHLNPSMGFPLSMPMQMQHNQLNLGNFSNMQLNSFSQIDLLNKLNAFGSNLQAIQQDQMNILKSNNPSAHQQHLIQVGNNGNNIRSHEIANTLNQFEKNHLQCININNMIL